MGAINLANSINQNEKFIEFIILSIQLIAIVFQTLLLYKQINLSRKIAFLPTREKSFFNLIKSIDDFDKFLNILTSQDLSERDFYKKGLNAIWGLSDACTNTSLFLGKEIKNTLKEWCVDGNSKKLFVEVIIKNLIDISNGFSRFNSNGAPRDLAG